MNALIAGTFLFGTINLVFFGGLHVIMELADRRRGRAHMCADRGSWCEHCIDSKQRAGIVNIYGKVIA